MSAIISEEQGRRLAVEKLRDLADEIERGTWGSISFEVKNHHRDKPRRSWDAFRGKDLVGRTIIVDLSDPTDKP